MPANGTHSIFFLAGGGISTTTNIIGRLFGTSSNMYFDFNEAFVFRQYINKNNVVNNTILTLNSLGMITKNIFADSITVTGVNLKTYTDTISGNLYNNYYNKTQSDNNYYDKSFIDSKLNTLTGAVTTGTITVNNISYGYTTLPTLSSTSLGYTINYSNTATTVTTASFTNSSVISVPIGIYLVQAYANFTPSSSFLYRLRLAINTTTSAFNDNLYNSLSHIFPANLSLQSIHYTTYLIVNTPTNFHFVFQTSVGGSLNGSLNGKFIRIA